MGSCLLFKCAQASVPPMDRASVRFACQDRVNGPRKRHRVGHGRKRKVYAEYIRSCKDAFPRRLIGGRVNGLFKAMRTGFQTDFNSTVRFHVVSAQYPITTDVAYHGSTAGE
jgi:hypothetical protein